MSWLTIESDPAVFSALISDLGVKDVLVEEVFSIDAESLDAISPNYGVIFLFKYQNDADKSKSTGTASYNEDIWFAHQIVWHPPSCVSAIRFADDHGRFRMRAARKHSSRSY